MIVWIPLSVFVLFIIAIIWAAKRDKEKNGYNIFTPMPKFEKNFIEIGEVKNNGRNAFDSVTESEGMLLSKFQQFINFPNDKLATLEFELKKQNPIQEFFEISDVILHCDGANIKAERILLMEKVPDYMAPPNGCRYFDHAYYSPFCLKKNYPSTFLFDVSFNKSIHALSTSNSITIQIELFNRSSTSIEKIDLKKIELKQCLSNLSSKNIIQFKHDLQNIYRE